jgi:hypothetical protein
MTRPRRRLPTEEVIAKERQALDLKRAGVTYDRIAEEVGYANRGAAYKAVHRAIERTHQDAADDLVPILVDRLERAHFAIWPKVIKGDPAAVPRMLRIMERLARLKGLDVATSRGEQSDLDAEILALHGELAAGAVDRPAGHPG